MTRTRPAQLALAAVLAAASTAAVTVPASAAPKPKPTPTEANTPCADMVVTLNDVYGDRSSDIAYSLSTGTPTVSGTMALAAPSCRKVTYAVTAYYVLNGAVTQLGSWTSAGDGKSAALTFSFPLTASPDYVGWTASTSLGDVPIDSAPEPYLDFQDINGNGIDDRDELAADGSPATASFR